MTAQSQQQIEPESAACPPPAGARLSAAPTTAGTTRAAALTPAAVTPALISRERRLCNGISPWLAPLAMAVTQDLALPFQFRRIHVLGRQHLPREGAVLLAPTHRARWDALVLPHAAGRRVTGRDCRFMVTRTEMQGLQGWFLHRLGCFPVDQSRPGTTPLRYAVDLLAAGQQLVVFPEGHIRREDGPIRLHQGLARLAALAAGQGVPVNVVPVGIAYGHGRGLRRDEAAVCFEAPLTVQNQSRAAVKGLNAELAVAMQSAEEAARVAVGRPMPAA